MTDQELKDLVASLAADTERSKALNKAGFAALREAQTKTDKQLKNLSETVDGIGKSQGMMAEEFFYNSLEANPRVAGIAFDDIYRGLKKSRQGKHVEIDVF
jgi:hypothetical protein